MVTAPRTSPASAATPSRFTTIDDARCRALLSSRTVGRVAWQAADGPQLFPVTYDLHDDTIVFRTSPYGVLSELIRPTPVVFEVDDIDEATRSGWNVIVRGRAMAVPEPARLVNLWSADGPVPWASGIRNLWITITIDGLSGRHLAGTAT